MLDQVDAVVSYGLVAAGLTHTALTPLFHPGGGEGALGFAGASATLGGNGA